MMRSLPTLLVIGAGNMAEAIVAGLAAPGPGGGAEPSQHILAVDPSPERRAVFEQRFGCRVAEALPASFDFAAVLLAVKPQAFGEVAALLGGRLTPRCLVISIMAGVTTQRIHAGLAVERVVRVMPNLPLTVGAGASGYFARRPLDAEERALIEWLFASAGEVVAVADEALMDVVTALSGSGPAYYYLLTEALIDAAVEAGLSVEAAGLLARQTCLGAARMMLAADAEPPAALRARVTSKGGTTAAALAAFEARGFREGVREAVRAAIERGRQLSAG